MTEDHPPPDPYCRHWWAYRRQDRCRLDAVPHCVACGIEKPGAREEQARLGGPFPTAPRAPPDR